MSHLTRRAILRGSLGLASASLARPFIANAAATTASLWWAQGFIPEEDAATVRKICRGHQKRAAIDLTDHACCCARRSSRRSSAASCPTRDYYGRTEAAALQAWQGNLVDVD